MPSSWTHAIAAVAVTAPFVPRDVPHRVWIAVAIAAILPDIDAIGRPLGGGDLEWLGGHRALTHSVTFAAGFALVVQLVVLQVAAGANALRSWLAVALGIASHGALDAFAAYGEGIQFLAPWSTTRYEAPWPLLGDGILGDSIAFVVFYGFARFVIVRRGLTLPRALNPGFLRDRGLTGLAAWRRGQ